MRYAIITGSGRSGTNWLLDMLDASPETHCRNEPHGLRGTPLHQFPMTWTSTAAGDLTRYRDEWDDVAEGTAVRWGVRDHHVPCSKPYLYPWTNLGLSRVLTSRQARRAWQRVDRRVGGVEWQLPRYLGSRRRLEDSLGVLKILIDGPLAAWLTTERTEVPVVHVVRHPGGRLSSWLNRLYGRLNTENQLELHRRGVDRMRLIAGHDPRWAALVPDPAALSALELELWFWRYVNESTWDAGRGRPSYLLLRFEDVAGAPLVQAERMFAHLGLGWNEAVRARIGAGTTTSVFGAVEDSSAKADAWRAALDDEALASMDRVLEGSPLIELLDA